MARSNFTLAQARFRSDLARTGVVNAKRQFTSFQRQMRQAHERMAESAAFEIRTVLADKVRETGRPQVARTRRGQGSHALEKAVVDERNRFAGYGGFTVMKTSFLESQPGVGEYYRNLEVGTEEFVGRQFRGFFILPGAARASRERFREQAIMVIHGPAGITPVENAALPSSTGGAYGVRRGTTKTNVIPADSLFAPVDRRKFDDEGNHVSGKGKTPIITIHNPIVGYHYVEQGMANWNASDSELRETQAAAKQAGLRMEGNRIIPPPMVKR